MSGNKIPTKYRQELFRVTDADLKSLHDSEEVSKETIKDSIRILKDWYDQQPHFPSTYPDDHVLTCYLTSNKFSIERAKAKIENLLTARSVVPDFFSIRDPMHPKISNIFKSVEWIIFPERTPDNYRVIYIRMKPNSDPQYFDPYLMYTMSLMIIDMRDAMDAANGEIQIWDNTNTSFAHISKMSPAVIKGSSMVIKQCYGNRVKAVHMLNVPAFAELMFNTTKSYLPKKIASRMFVHNKLEDLYEHIPKAIFPKDMGGDEPLTASEIADTWKTALQSDEWRQWFKDTEMLKTDESRRPKNAPNIISEEYGVSGSFRKLNVD